MSTFRRRTGFLCRIALSLLLLGGIAHAALLFHGIRPPLLSVPLYAPGFAVDAEGMRVRLIPLAGTELRSVAINGNAGEERRS